MEGGEAMSGGVAVKGDEAPEGYGVAPRTENPNQLGGSTMPPVTPPVSVGTSSTGLKKKRGRPRKYGPDGSLAMALSPMPISSSIPLTGDCSAWKRGRGRPADSLKKQHKLEFENSGVGEKLAFFVGANFTPHVITVNAGEDVTMKILLFSQQGSRAICILSANGSISNVTLRQPNSSGGTLTYEGRFEILSLSGSFMPTETAGTKSRSGGMSVSLAGPDGRVLGGGIAGLLVAAGPVQVVVGSFLPGHQLVQKPKKQRAEPTISISPSPVNAIYREEVTFHGDNGFALNSFQATRNSDNENNTSLPGSESQDLNQSKTELSC
ncbi:PPC domain [Dillenia turbinata]|uniref:AT-hook motif nuclear-localized protein n=1 Tax=Dillenia turbinata TaxID=194707 RepID=A0AAN8VJQ5_9MAGN